MLWHPHGQEKADAFDEEVDELEETSDVLLFLEESES